MNCKCNKQVLPKNSKFCRDCGFRSLEGVGVCLVKNCFYTKKSGNSFLCKVHRRKETEQGKSYTKMLNDPDY